MANKVPPWQRPSSAPADLLGVRLVALGSSALPGHATPLGSQLYPLGCSNEPPPKPPMSLRLAIATSRHPGGFIAAKQPLIDHYLMNARQRWLRV